MPQHGDMAATNPYNYSLQLWDTWLFGTLIDRHSCLRAGRPDDVGKVQCCMNPVAQNRNYVLYLQMKACQVLIV